MVVAVAVAVAAAAAVDRNVAFLGLRQPRRRDLHDGLAGDRRVEMDCSFDDRSAC